MIRFAALTSFARLASALPRIRKPLLVIVWLAVCTLGFLSHAKPEPLGAQVACPDFLREPNNSFDTASVLNPANRPSGEPDGLVGAICPSGDEDWFVFNPPANSRVRVTLTGLPHDYDIELRVPEAFGTTRVVSGSYEPGTQDESITVDTVFGSTLYLRVYGVGGVWNSISEYRLRVWYTDIPTGGSCPDTYEPNDTLAGAWLMTPGTRVSSYICSGQDGFGDRDWFAFDVAQAGDTIQVDLTGHAIDIDMRLYDPDGVDVAASVQNGPGAEEDMRHTTTRAGRYTVHVFAKTDDSDETRPYALDVRLSSVAPPCTDAFEPNGTRGIAAPIQSGQGIQGRICPMSGGRSDVDWFSLAVGSGATIRVDLQGMPVPLQVALWRPDGSYWRTWSSTGTAPLRFDTMTDAAGTWYVQLSPQATSGGHIQDTYYMEIFALTGGSTCSDSYEPNEDRAEAQAVTYRAYDAKICTAEDEDWYTFVPTTGTSIRVDLAAPPQDYDLELYNHRGDRIAQSMRGGMEAESVSVERAGGDRLYVRVFGYDGAHDRSHDYRITFAASAPPTLGCTEGYEPNETRQTAHVFATADQRISAWICDPSDRDWYGIPVQMGQHIELLLEDLPADFELDLYRPDGNRVAFSANGGVSDETIHHEAQETGTYYVQVFGFSTWHDSTEPYTLQIAVTQGPVSPCGESYEPNETFAAASPVALAGRVVEVFGWICDANDEDWYRLDLAAETRFIIRLKGLPADYDLVVYDETTGERGRSALGGTAEESIAVTLPAGQNRVRVTGYEGAFDAGTRYRLQFERPDEPGGGGGLQPCNESFEPNETRAQAAVLGLGIVQQGFLCDANDVDWFRTTVSAGMQVVAQLVPPTGIDLELELYADGDLVTLFSRNGGDTPEAITYTASAVAELAWHVYGYAGAADPINPYVLEVDTVTAPPGSSGACNEWFEPNEIFGDAVDLAPGTIQVGYICDASDQDWFKVALRPGQTFEVELRDLPADYDLHVYDPAGTLIALSNAEGLNPERVERTVTHLGAHRVRVFGYAGASNTTQTYELELTFSERSAPPSATPTPSPAVSATPTPSTTPTETRTPRPKASATGTATSPPKDTATPTRTSPPKPSVTPVGPGGETATPTPTAAPKPTSTPTPTATASPTAAPKPSGTPTSTPEPTSTAGATATADAGPSDTPGPIASATPTQGTGSITPTTEPQPTQSTRVRIYAPFTYKSMP